MSSSTMITNHFPYSSPIQEEAPSTATSRRSAKYPPTAWESNFIQSLTRNNYPLEIYGEQREKLINDVKRWLFTTEAMANPLLRIELVDTIERLGLNRHFKAEIANIMEMVNEDAYSEDSWFSSNENLYATALQFRLLRQHGYDIPEDVFKEFMDASGNFNPLLSEDVRGLLSLYEASFIGWEGDTIVDEARAFSTLHLKRHLSLKKTPNTLAQKVEKSLEMPLHWRPKRLEARWSIETYQREKEQINPTLLKLAMLDFNICQQVYKEEILYLERWWKNLGLVETLPFIIRDRLLEIYCWNHFWIDQVEYGTARKVLWQISCLLTLIDDTYDIYGTVKELEILTDVINRWDYGGIDELPYPMNIIFLAVYNNTNEIGYQCLKDNGFNCIPCLSKGWATLCNFYLKEAKWYHNGYKPSLEEHLGEAHISVGCSIVFPAWYLFTAEIVSKEGADYSASLPKIFNSCCLIVRLNNDIGTFSDELERGDSFKSLQCYMNDKGVSEEEARAYIEGMIHETWKKLNTEQFLRPQRLETNLGSISPYTFAQGSHFFYQYRSDNYGHSNNLMKERLEALLIEPFPFE